MARRDAGRWIRRSLSLMLVIVLSFTLIHLHRSGMIQLSVVTRTLEHHMRVNNIAKIGDHTGLVSSYNLQGSIRHLEDIKCVNLTTDPSVLICPHSRTDYLSAIFLQGRIWESHVVSKMKTLLGSDCRFGLIDIGANIGYFSLIAASMGHQVVAVEPLDINVVRLHKALKLARADDNVVLIQNALSNFRGETDMLIVPSNIGGSSLIQDCTSKFTRCANVTTIFMDDLLPYMTFKKAIMKIDIEGHEERAMIKATKLLSQIDIPYIFMEFMKQKRICEYIVTLTSKEKYWLLEMFDLLRKNKYKPYSGLHDKVLQIEQCQDWPDDILWIKNGLPYPLPWPTPIN